MIQVRAHTRRKAINPKREAIHAQLQAECSALVEQIKREALLNNMSQALQAEVEADLRAAVEFEPVLGDVAFLRDGGLS